MYIVSSVLLLLNELATQWGNLNRGSNDSWFLQLQLVNCDDRRTYYNMILFFLPLCKLDFHNILKQEILCISRIDIMWNRLLILKTKIPGLVHKCHTFDYLFVLQDVVNLQQNGKQSSTCDCNWRQLGSDKKTWPHTLVVVRSALWSDGVTERLRFEVAFIYACVIYYIRIVNCCSKLYAVTAQIWVDWKEFYLGYE